MPCAAGSGTRKRMPCTTGSGTRKRDLLKHYIMIGAPVTAVRTPSLLEAYFSRHATAAAIETRHVESDELQAFIGAVAADKTIDGLLVTMPHKKAIVARLDDLTTEAGAAGSVNAVKRLDSGLLAGAQFDGIALLNALLTKGIPVAESRILLAGLGGAGLAIAQAITAHGCRSLSITDTDRTLLDRIGNSLQRSAGFSVSELRDPTSGDHDLLINATPLGMHEDDSSPFSEDQVGQAMFVADIVADPLRTRLAALVAEAGATLISGRDMVKGQIEPIGHWLLNACLEQ